MNRFFGLVLLGLFVAMSLLALVSLVLPWMVNQHSWITFAGAPLVAVLWAWLIAHLLKKVLKK